MWMTPWPTSCFATSSAHTRQGRLRFSRWRLTTSEPMTNTPINACTMSAVGPSRWQRSAVGSGGGGSSRGTSTGAMSVAFMLAG